MTLYVDPLVAVLVVIGVALWVAAGRAHRAPVRPMRRRPRPVPSDPELTRVLTDLVGPEGLEIPRKEDPEIDRSDPDSTDDYGNASL